MIPLIVLKGDAGVGKDTLAEAVTRRVNGVRVGFADALKQMARDIFEFNDGQLFGPSSERDKVDPFWSPQAITRTKNHLIEVGMGWAEKLGLPARESKDGLNEWRELLFQGAHAHGALSSRFVLQTLGTEFGRAIDPTVWVRHTIDVSMKLMDGGWAYTREEGLRMAMGMDPPGCVVIPDGRFPNEIMAVKRVGGKAVLVTRPYGFSTVKTGKMGHASEGSRIPNHYFDLIVDNRGSLESFQELGGAAVTNLIVDRAPWREVICR